MCNYHLWKEKFKRLGSLLDEIVLHKSLHKCYVVIGRRDIIRELGNHCHAGLLYFRDVGGGVAAFESRITDNVILPCIIFLLGQSHLLLYKSYVSHFFPTNLH